MLKLSFRQQVLTGFVISLFLVFYAFYFSYTSIDKLLENEKLIEYTESVIRAANRVQALILDSETGQRGYIASGEKKFLDPYNKSILLVPSTLAALKELVANDSVQMRNVDSLSFFANLKSEELKSIIIIPRAKGFDTARKTLATNPGKYYMDQVRVWKDRITEKENKLLKIGKASSSAAAGATVNAILVTGIIVACIIIMLSF